MLWALGKARVGVNAQSLQVGFGVVECGDGFRRTLRVLLNNEHVHHDDRSPTHPTRPPRRASAPHVLAAAVAFVVLSSGITCLLYVLGRESVPALELHNG